MTRHTPTVTDHPSALVSVPEMKTLSAGERAFTAWAATSRADGTPLMWTWSEMPHSQQERWEKIALAAAPAAPQAAGVRAVDEVARWHEDRAAFLTSKAADDVWAETEAQLHRDMAASLRPPSREPEGGAVDARAVAKILNPALFSHDKVEAHRAASPHTVTSARIDAVDSVRKVLDAAAIATREEAPAEAGEVECDGCDGDRCVYVGSLCNPSAQPQAREEAQPVAGLTVHLVSDGGDIHRIRKWENHGLREGTHRLYTTPPAPEAEKLRVAVEALEKIKLQRDVGLGTQSIAVEALQALAALQQEGW